MPIDEVFLEDGECLNLASKRLQREEYWYKELASIYPYGLNDNVKKVGNISKKGTENISAHLTSLICVSDVTKKPFNIST